MKVLRTKYKLILPGALLLAQGGCATPHTTADTLSALPAIGRVDERFQSYNVEMVEVTGGRFWAPYGDTSSGRYAMRPAMDLSDTRLRLLARQLAPAYMRVSGTWANNTYVQAAGESGNTPPPGFRQVLTAAQWKGVVDFSNAVDAPIVPSFAVSLGTRGADKRWKTGQAQRLVDHTRAFGGKIGAVEFFNEPNMPSAADDLPPGYTAVDYGKDFSIFLEWARRELPGVTILGTGSVTEDRPPSQIPVPAKGPPISSADMMAETPGVLDALSYHFYGIVSQRCESIGIGTAAKEDALKPAWLDLTLRAYDYYAGLRDTYEPGKPMWVTETAQASCGGSPWAASFLDTFRYLNQMGVLAQKDVKVIMHNTLAASDYALIDDVSGDPRPSYWAAVLWRRIMGDVVLAPPTAPSASLKLFAHCLRGSDGGVALLALNIGERSETVSLDRKARAWVMTAEPIDSKTVKVNGTVPAMEHDGSITGLEARAVSGQASVPAKSVAFFGIASAGNPACAVS